jgi:hypothetical protein
MNRIQPRNNQDKEPHLCDCCYKFGKKGRWVVIDLLDDNGKFRYFRVVWYCLSCINKEDIPKTRIIQNKQHFQELITKLERRALLND